MNQMADWRIEILPILEQIGNEGVNIDIMRKLFIEGLNYDFADQEALIEFPESIRKKVLSIKIISEKNGFKVLFCIIDSLLKGVELPVVKSISRYHPANIIIFTNRESNEAHFINTKYVGKEQDKKAKGFRRITVSQTDRLRTAAERLSRIYASDGISAFDLMSNCEEAFDIEAVSKEFYKKFVEKYKELRKVIRENNRLSDVITENITQEIINRLLFLYFIQKKGWLNGDYKFLYNNFKSNKKEYYKNFLVPLFKKLSIKDFKSPGSENIPFLNGGLFEFQEIEEKISIPDESFEDIFNDLLERFNFTIREDTEFEEEVAIDPEMLGKIFEELILSIESEKYKDIPDPRRASGSYYTPRFIVSFMVKESLLNYLISELPHIPRSQLKSLVFDLSTEKIEKAALIKSKLLDLKIVDPGVGSGAFSVDILSKLLRIIEKLNEKLGLIEDRYNLRKKLIEDCIYGVDIQERAVHLARLRLWLSLIVDLDVEKIKDIPPLINLDFKIVQGDSLVSKICGFKFDLEALTRSDQRILELIEKYKELKDKYSEAVTDTKKQVLKERIIKTKCAIAIWHLENIKKQHKEELKLIGAQGALFERTKKEIRVEEQKREILAQKLTAINEKIEEIKAKEDIEAFNWYLDFFEVMGAKEGFDIVIANPPYGVDVDRNIYKIEFGLDSKDSYGVFAALGVNILKPGGTLCYIMSDTWQTIRTHHKLREKLLEETEAQYLISVPMKTFGATVNTGIYLFKKSTTDEEKENIIITADFHGLDIKRGDLEAALDLIIDEEPDEQCEDGYTIISDREMAIYAYRQKVIKKFSNFSFFIASPKLFRLMQDVGNVKPKTYTDEKGSPVMFDIKKEKDLFDLFQQAGPNVRRVNFNGEEIELVKLGDIAKVVVGLQTGDNDYYLRKLPSAKGSNYKDVDSNLVLKEEELEKIRKDKKLRLDVIESGVCTNPDHETHQHRFFGGRYFVPYDKGGASNIEEGWLPNYYVPTPYFIDWSERAVRRLKTLKDGKGRIVSRFQNKEFYFREGISFSDSGIYAPTFRIFAGHLFDQKGSLIMPLSTVRIKEVLSSISSKLGKYILKNYANHSISSHVDSMKMIVLPVPNELSDRPLSFIIQKQKQNPGYDYMTNEQLEIDKLVYEMYNLNQEDIEEVENWYFRRYPKLARIIEEKLKRKDDG